MTPQPAMGVSELLPCPFCGGEATAYNYVVEATAACNVCRAGVTRTHGTYDDNGLPEAIAAWNRRAALPHMQPAGEGVDWRGHFVSTTEARYRDAGMKVEQARIHAENDARGLEAMRQAALGDGGGRG